MDFFGLKGLFLLLLFFGFGGDFLVASWFFVCFGCLGFFGFAFWWFWVFLFWVLLEGEGFGYKILVFKKFLDHES